MQATYLQAKRGVRVMNTGVDHMVYATNADRRNSSAVAGSPVGYSSRLAARTNEPFVEELPRLLHDRELSLRELARRARVDPSHLSRVLRGANYKSPSADLARKVSIALNLPPDYFPEFRESIVLQRIRADSALRERLYAGLK